jgi:hypothetical protein
MALKQAAAGEALAVQINGISRSEMYDMMSKMKVRHPQTALFLSRLLCLSPSTRLFTDLLTVLLMFLCYTALTPRRA